LKGIPGTPYLILESGNSLWDHSLMPRIARAVAAASLAGEVFVPRDGGKISADCGAVHRIKSGPCGFGAEARGILLEQCASAPGGPG